MAAVPSLWKILSTKDTAAEDLVIFPTVAVALVAQDERVNGSVPIFTRSCDPSHGAQLGTPAWQPASLCSFRLGSGK